MRIRIPARSTRGARRRFATPRAVFRVRSQLVVDLLMRSDRHRRSQAAALFVIVGSVISGCATRVPERPIAYVPQANVQLVKGADRIPVEIKVEDLQPSESINRLALMVDRTDELRFRVKEAADTLKAATETELKARGFNIGSGGAVITIKMVHFEANYQSEDLGFVTTVRGSLFMRVQVQSQTGKVVYSKEVEDQAHPHQRILPVASSHAGAPRITRGRVQGIVRRSRIHGRDPGGGSAASSARKARQSRPYRRRFRHNVATLIPSISAASSSVIACSSTTSMWRRSICSSVLL